MKEAHHVQSVTEPSLDLHERLRSQIDRDLWRLHVRYGNSDLRPLWSQNSSASAPTPSVARLASW